MADLSGVVGRYDEAGASVARSWAALRDVWLDADAEEFAAHHITEALESLRRLAEELAGAAALCGQARRELT